MLGLNGRPLLENITMYYLNDYGLILIIAVLFSMPLYEWIKAVLIKNKLRASTKMGIDLVHIFFVLVIFTICITRLVNSTYNPFIYFRF